MIATLIRHLEKLTEDKDAGYFDEEAFSESIDKVRDYILNRVTDISMRSDDKWREDTEDIKAEIQDFVEFWRNIAQEARETGRTPLCFGRRYMVKPPSAGEKRLFKQFGSEGKDTAKETLTSMRNVDSNVTGSVIIWEDSE